MITRANRSGLKNLLILQFVITAFALRPFAQSAPINDLCSNPRTLYANASATSGTTNFTADDGPAPSCAFSNGPDVWYQLYYSGGDLYVSVSSETPSSFPNIALYDACGGNELMCSTDDANFPGNPGRAGIEVTDGSIAPGFYLVQVTTIGASGMHSISASLSNSQWFLPSAIGTGPAVIGTVAPEGYVLAANQACVQGIVENDPYCVTDFWDGICQDAYLCCQEITGCANPAACNYEPDACPDNTLCIFPEGCTDATACNYDTTAQCDDGSCVFGTCYFLPVTIGAGPVVSGSTAPFGYEYAGNQACVQNIIDDDPYCIETSWDLICERAYNCCIGYFGCTDFSACNYDSDACPDNSLCIYGAGCTDINACNYTPSATCDDGSCFYGAPNSVCEGAVLMLPDVGITPDISTSCAAGPPIACEDPLLESGMLGGQMLNVWYRFTSTAGGPATLVSPYPTPFSLLSDDDFHWIQVYDGCGGEMIACSGNIYDLFGGIRTYPSVTFDTECGKEYFIQFMSNDSSLDWEVFLLEGPNEGCTDPSACNYSPCATEDGSCDYSFGCTDITACNYDPSAICDDESCEGNIPGAGEFGFCLYDLDGDCQVTGDELCSDFDDIGEVFEEGRTDDLTIVADDLHYLAIDYMLLGCSDLGTPPTLTVRLNDAVIYCKADIVTVECGPTIGTLDFCLTEPTLDRIYIPRDALYGFESGSNNLVLDWTGTGILMALVVRYGNAGAIVEGCSDPVACNYDPGVSGACGNASCLYPGCQDPNACNFSSSAGCSDPVLCEFSTCYGCTYPSSPNFNPSATRDDGSCIGFDANDCPTDLDNTGDTSTSDLLIVLGAFGSSCP